MTPLALSIRGKREKDKVDPSTPENKPDGDCLVSGCLRKKKKPKTGRTGDDGGLHSVTAAGRN